MKKIIVVLVLSLLALSCEKDSNEPQSSDATSQLMEVTFHGDIWEHHKTVKVNGVKIDNHTTNVKTGDVITMHGYNHFCPYDTSTGVQSCSKVEVKLSLNGIHRTQNSCYCPELEYEFVID